MKPAQLKKAFDEDSDEYKCLFGKLHVKFGAVIVLVLGIALVATNIVFYRAPDPLRIGKEKDGTLFLALIGATNISVGLVACACLGLALKNGKMGLVMPFQFWIKVLVIILIISLLVAMIIVINPTSDLSLWLFPPENASVNDSGSPSRIPGTLLLIFLIASAGVLYECSSTMVKYYNYLKDKNDAQSHMPI